MTAIIFPFLLTEEVAARCTKTILDIPLVHCIRNLFKIKKKVVFKVIIKYYFCIIIIFF